MDEILETLSAERLAHEQKVAELVSHIAWLASENAVISGQRDECRAKLAIHETARIRAEMHEGMESIRY